MRYCESYPVLTEIGTESEECVSGVDELVVEAKLGLQVGCIAEDVHVFLGCYGGV